MTMYSEFCIYNKNYTDRVREDIKSVFDAIKYGVNGINVNSYFLKKCPFVDQVGLVISVPIDYPQGIRDKKVRQAETIFALRGGANAVDLVINPLDVSEKNFSAIKHDLETHKKICDDYNASFRPIINFHLFTSNESLWIAKLIEDSNVEFVLPSNGLNNNDIYDTVTISSLIKDKFPNLSIILTGHIWNNKQLGLVKDTTFFGIRLYSLDSLTKIV